MINNPYIELVKNHKYIFTEVSTIYKHKNKWDSYFSNNNKIILEIWTGLWNFFSREVRKNNDNNFVGMEIKYKRLYVTAEKSLGNLNSYTDNGTRPKRILKKIEKKNQEWWGMYQEQGSQHIENTIHNNFALLKDFWENIEKIFWENEVSKTYIFFPDPWAKKKKWLKNRLLQQIFLKNLYIITQKEGSVIIKTDHREYFDFILWEVEKTSWKIQKKSYDWENENDFHNTETTEFQQLFRWQNIAINYLELIK